MKDFTEEIDRALDLLLKVQKQTPGKKNLLDKAKTLYLQVVLFKVPFFSGRKRKFLKLKHSLYGDAPEICLFVPNRKTGVQYKKTTDELIDFCIEYYTELLEKHKVKGITTVMPLKQLQSEYGAYELRRKLVQRFDLFLCKNSLLYNSRFLTSLGKIFRLANKDPLGVPFPKEQDDFDDNFQKNIDRAIFTSSFYINSFSDNYSIPVGCMSHTKAQLGENLKMVLNQILTENIIPGGFKNIKTLFLWPSQSKPIPLYMSQEVPVGLKPRIKSKRKRAKGVEDELSTQPGKKVFVMPNGDVFVRNMENVKKSEAKAESEDEDSFHDDSEEEEEEEKEDNDKGEQDEDEDEVEQMRRAE